MINPLSTRFSNLSWVTTPSDGYRDRTAYNAQASHATIYFMAKDVPSPGLQMTQEHATNFFRQVIPNDHSTVPILVECLDESGVECPRLNVAGNRLSKFGWVPQNLVNTWVYTYLEKVAREIRGLRILSGGQTGADWAGIVAGVKLDIPVSVTMPRNFKQEGKNTPYRENTVDQLEARLHDDLIYLDRLL